VRESTSARGPLPRATGIIDSLSAGFGVVNEQPWIILLPVVLDLFFLFGPRVSIAPVVSQIVTRPQFVQTFGADVTAPAIAFAEEANLLGLLSAGGLTLPTIVPVLGLARGSYTMLDSGGAVALLALASVLLGAFVGCIYRAILAQQVQDGELSALRLPAETVVAWYRIVILSVVVCVVAFLVMLPLAFIAAVASLVTSAAMPVMSALVATLVLAAQLYLFFIPNAIFMNQVGPIQAIRRGAAVIHAGVWSALTLAILVTVITIGMSQIWILLASQASWGLALGIVGNAYIASGLVAASMLFYRERMEFLLAQRS
jgi:hypothetical protein